MQHKRRKLSGSTSGSQLEQWTRSKRKPAQAIAQRYPAAVQDGGDLPPKQCKTQPAVRKSVQDNEQTKRQPASAKCSGCPAAIQDGGSQPSTQKMPSVRAEKHIMPNWVRRSEHQSGYQLRPETAETSCTSGATKHSGHLLR